MSTASAKQDGLTLTVGGQAFTGWTEVRVTRGLERMTSDFDLSVSQKPNQKPWRILPFSPCTLSLGGVLVLTGFVDSYIPSIGPTSHGVRIAGRSATCDLIDCCPNVPGGQFSGYNLGQIAGAICKIFKLTLVEQTDTTNTFADATIERAETCYRFLERLCRLSGVLATDNAAGNLVLTATGSTRAASRITQGGNVVQAHATLSGAKRFSNYIVKGQSSLPAASANYIAAPGGGIATGPAGGAVLTQQRAEALDPAVPRYRPHVAMAESMLDQKGMQARVQWMARYAAGRATMAQVEVPGFHQTDGTLWQVNQLVACDIPYLAIAQDLLIVTVTYRLGKDGARTELTLGSPEAYAPDPGQVKLHKKRGHTGTGVSWSGLASGA
jgi:prophage tail gpP-like protein